MALTQILRYRSGLLLCWERYVQVPRNKNFKGEKELQNRKYLNVKMKKS